MTAKSLNHMGPKRFSGIGSKQWLQLANVPASIGEVEKVALMNFLVLVGDQTGLGLRQLNGLIP